MTFEEFDKYQANLLTDVIDMGTTKGKEYAHSIERFANFNRISEKLQVPRLQVALVYLEKHMDGISSFIATSKISSNEPIQGRIIDAITYLTLIGGMIYEDEVKSKEKI